MSVFPWSSIRSLPLTSIIGSRDENPLAKSQKYPFKKLIDIYKARRQRQLNEEASTPSLTPAQYIDALKRVDFGSQHSIATFDGKAKSRGARPAPKPLILGYEAGYQYILESKFADYKLDNPLKIPYDQQHSQIVGIKAHPDHDELQYVFRLGTLVWVPASVDVTSPKFSREELRRTPFKVFIDPLNKSLWLILDPHRVDEDGEDDSIPGSANTWDFLPSKSNGRSSFDILKLFDWGELDALKKPSKKREIFSEKAIKSAARLQTTLQVVTEDAWAEAVKALGTKKINQQ